MAFPCTNCSKILGRNDTLKLHLAKCKGNVNLLCGDCNKEFQSPWHLKRHQRQKHTVEKSFLCDKCSRKFHHKAHLIRHVNSIHGTTKTGNIIKTTVGADETVYYVDEMVRNKAISKHDMSPLNVVF